MMQSFFLLCMLSVQWVLFGYSALFRAGFHRTLHRQPFMVRPPYGVTMAPNTDYASTIPHMLFAIFQMMFAVITPALITGAFAERMKFGSFAIFSLLWATFVYDPSAIGYGDSGGWLKRLAPSISPAGPSCISLRECRRLSARSCSDAEKLSAGPGSSP